MSPEEDPACCVTPCVARPSGKADPCMPLPLPQEVLDDVVPKAKDYAQLKGSHAVIFGRFVNACWDIPV